MANAFMAFSLGNVVDTIDPLYKSSEEPRLNSGNHSSDRRTVSSQLFEDCIKSLPSNRAIGRES
ncbi:hypothetical protein J0895_17445 [Phormidium pseudopriestleyi FRX01]|uniref:Uncharacterized protein n=1 Tax=Phormidium pseudopriestleyi FRX01 TaxID=1759528 RepID=A0ABS3FWT6_9CYAN|nr:hypothetical protein [Phormidium pseudopriestleyi]MBO0350817.1 hypothetical protein [Phormidium pseudopriestleyi FRX01]